MLDDNTANLLQQTTALIPDHAWTQVRQAIIVSLVDNMPDFVLKTLTGTYDDFDRAEKILYDYYELPTYQEELISDAFQIMGEVNCLELLSSLNLQEQ